MNLYDFVFYLFAVIIIGSAFMVVTTRNIIHSAYYLLFTLFGISGIYALLGADFLSIVQIMVYVGGILVLILFGVMLTNKITNVQIKSGTLQIIPAIIGTGILCGILLNAMYGTQWKSVYTAFPDKTTAVALGKMLITDYVLIFELLGVLLLVVLIGAATIARREER